MTNRKNYFPDTGARSRSRVAWLALVGAMTGIAGLYGCGAPTAGEELQEWRNKGVAPLELTVERPAREAYQRVFARRERAPGEYVRVITTSVIPAYRTLASKLDEIRPSAPEVRGLHALYKSMIRKKLAWYEAQADAYATHDSAARERAESIRGEARYLVRVYEARSLQLLKKYGLDVANNRVLVASAN